MGYTNGPTKTFQAGSAALEPYRLVKLTSGNLGYSTTADLDAVGQTLYPVAAGQDTAVRLINAGGTLEVAAAGVITLNADVYLAPSGKIQALPDSAGTYTRIGQALQAAGQDGDIIEILPGAIRQDTV